MTKKINEKIKKIDPIRRAIFKRSQSELKEFMKKNDLDIHMAAKILQINLPSLRNFIYVTDYPRIPRVETFAKWANMKWPDHIKKNANGTVIDYIYIISGSRTNIYQEEINRLKGDVKNLEAQLRRESFEKMKSAN